MSYEGRTYIVVVSPICIAVRACSPIGAALVGVDAARLATDAAAAWSSSPGDDEGGATIFDGDGRTLGATGLPIPRLDVAEALQAVRRTTHAGSEEIATLYAPLEVQGSRIGTLAVAVKTAPALAAAKGARYWLIPVLLAGLAGLVGIGSLLTRSILKQVRSLVATNRALGSGLLTARVPVSSRDELGELALGLNQMAEQLQANVQTLEMRVEQRTEEIHRLMLERSEFFAALSHELRTPLAVILAEAKMLHDPAYRKKGGWSSHAGHTIEESAGQLLALVNDILELAKAEAGHIDVKREPVRLTDVVKGARRTIEGLGKGAGIRVRVNIPADLPPVWGDQVRLREVVIGLVENAVKYTPSGGRITVSAAARNGHVEIAVSDTGVGIPPDARERIFEPFFRVQGTTALRGQPSTGLGLALAKRLVEAQEGTIDFVSELGTGTTFRFTLRPVDPAAGPEPASP
jgi:signal transduction histidine kinase